MVRKAAEIEEITFRLGLISDMNAAFFGGKEHLQKLQKIYDEICGHEVSWEADPDWKERINKYKR